jgi:MFS family permease
MTHLDAASSAAPAAPAALGEPTRRVGAGWIAAFATAWFGIWMAQLTPVQLLLPAQVDEQLHPEDWVDSVVAFGAISGVAALATIIAYPLTGALSDRTTSRFGRRRPWILIGALVFAVSLVLLGFQSEMWAIGAAWVAASVGFCIMTAALTATISDQVPVNQRGFVSGWMSAPQAVGIIAGLLLVTELVTDRVAGYALLAAILVVLAVPFLFRHDEPLTGDRAHRVTAKHIIAGFWISPRKHPDFGWTLLSRVMVSIGNALGTSLLLYFLMFQLDDEHAEDDLILLTLIYMVFVILASLGLGSSPTGSGGARPSCSSPPACRASRRSSSRSCPTSRSPWSPPGSSGSATAASSRSTRRSPRRCCRMPRRAARTSAS